MYSKNDYRYYLENKIIHSDDFLAHYGVKNMKWGKHKPSQTINDTAQFVSDIGIINYTKGKKLYNESIKKRAHAWRMDTVAPAAEKSVKMTKLINKKRPQIKAASRLIVAETANAASTGINNALRKKRKRKRI